MSKYERISCHSFVVVNGFAYFSNLFYNGLFKVELKTGKTLFLGRFQDEIQNEFNIHWESFQRDNLIYFLPRRGRHVHIYSLVDGSISAIEIRKQTERFFRIGEVIQEEDNLAFVPIEENVPIKKMSLITLSVEDIDKKEINLKGVFLSKDKVPFPVPMALEKYQIEKETAYSWKQISDGNWYAFWRKGCKLLKYVPETENICAVQLTILNEVELNKYLKPLRFACLQQGQLLENDALNFKEYLNALVIQLDDKSAQHENSPTLGIGDSIWKYVKN